jgi:predicted regulator of Ras-like GTPase activity (Roadblock/LC7/MglB family)
MNETPFTPILRSVCTAIPEAVGVVFADWEGEAVDQFPDPRRGAEEDAAARLAPVRADAAEPVDLRLFGAHWGVILNHVNAAMRTFHYGDPQVVMLHHDRMDVLIRTVSEQYYVLLAMRTGSHLGRALQALEHAAQALREEM